MNGSRYRWRLDRLDQLRKDKTFEMGESFTLKRLAQIAGVEPLTLRKWINGQIEDPDKVEGIKAIADYWNIPLSDLYEEVDNGDPSNGNQPVQHYGAVPNPTLAG